MKEKVGMFVSLAVFAVAMVMLLDRFLDYDSEVVEVRRTSAAVFVSMRSPLFGFPQHRVLPADRVDWSEILIDPGAHEAVMLREVGSGSSSTYFFVARSEPDWRRVVAVAPVVRGEEK